MVIDYFTIAVSALSVVTFLSLMGLLLYNYFKSSELIITLNIFCLKKYSALLRPNKASTEFVEQTRDGIKRRTTEMVGRNIATTFDITLFAAMNLVLLAKNWDTSMDMLQVFQVLYPIVTVLGVSLWHCGNLRLQKNVLLSYSLIDYDQSTSTQTTAV
jgi:hypothetical protein